MSLTDPLGDLAITDPQAMRALAHPVRLAVLMFLRRNGPATATQLSPHVGATPSVTSWHLRHLATFGLVVDAEASEVPGDRRQRWWKAAARGFLLEASEGDESRDPAQAPAGRLQDLALRQADRWRAEVEPQLEHSWRRLAGLSNTTVRVTAAELERVVRAIDELLGEYVRRPEADAPADARRVRILRHILPEAASGSGW